MEISLGLCFLATKMTRVGQHSHELRWLIYGGFINTTTKLIVMKSIRSSLTLLPFSEILTKNL